MPREPKPYYRKFQNRWVCTIAGQRVTLGADKQEAFRKFRELMLDKMNVPAERSTVYELSQTYLDWCEGNRKKGTYDNHKRYLNSFIGSIGKSLKIRGVKKHHVLSWSAQFKNSTTQNDAISIVQRMFNWAVELEYIAASPIPKVGKPRRNRREIVYSPEQWKQVKKHATGPLIPFLDFLWSTGCRPKEARTLEARHIHDELVIFPPDESKGETDSRVIFLTPTAVNILQPLLTRHPDGLLFRNSRGNAWTKDSIKCRLTRISEKVGFRVIAYGTRHSYATNALIRSVDSVSLSHLLGHKDTRMVNNYAHLAGNTEFLKEQANRAGGQ